VSIIQEALKKAQGDFTEKDIPQVKRDIVRANPAKDVSGQPATRASARHEHGKAPSVRLPALVAVLVILLAVYGFRLSLKYVNNNSGATHTAPAAAVAGKTNPAPKTTGLLGQPSDPGLINFGGLHQPALILNGIMYLENKPQAIINGQVLEEGDKINNATVLAIEKDCVLLNLNDTNLKLDLNRQN
jgi:hypothetical protein